MRLSVLKKGGNMSFEKLRLVLVILVAPTIVFPSIVYGEDQDFYCVEFYDKYREIGYWAKKVIFARDYDYGSGDANYLNVSHDVPDEYIDETDREIVTHFNLEFQNHLQKNISFHDAEAGRDDRWSKAYRDYGDNDHFHEMFQAEQEARRNALYGSNPGAIYCHIRIERREFPVLYEMECAAVANAQLRNVGGIKKSILGYSTPEYIIGELKNSITEQLQNLGATLEAIRNCP